MTRKQVTRVFLTGSIMKMSMRRTPVHGLNVEAIGDLSKGTEEKEMKNRCEKPAKNVKKACDDFSDMLTIMTQASLF